MKKLSKFLFFSLFVFFFLCSVLTVYAENAAVEPRYYLSDVQYSGMSVTGKVIHDETTPTVERIKVRVTYFIAGNYNMSTNYTVSNDGLFEVFGVGPIMYISVCARGLVDDSYIDLDAFEIIVASTAWDDSVPVSDLQADYSDNVLTVSASALDNFYTILIDGINTGRTLSPESSSVIISKAIADGIHKVTISNDFKGSFSTYFLCGEIASDFILPAALNEIDEESFSGVSAAVIHIPSSVTYIGSKAFANCENLQAIFIGDQVSYIAPDAFENSPNAIAIVPDTQRIINLVVAAGMPYAIIP